MKAVTSAGTSTVPPSTSELLALQSGMYRYSEAIDLGAKLVERTTNGVKTVLQGQS